MLHTEVTCMDGQVLLHFSWNSTMLQIDVTLPSNFLHLITLSQTALVTHHCLARSAHTWIPRPAVHLSQNRWKRSQNTKNKKCIARYFASFFVFRSFFAFRISLQGWHLREKSKDLVVYFFTALIKHEIHMKYKKCIGSVSYFMVCCVKTSAKCEIWNVYS